MFDIKSDKTISGTKLMDNDGLNFPLEYFLMPQFFDAHNILDDSEDKNRALLHILKKLDVKSIHDITCGTGAQVFYLHEHGFEISGSDLSQALIDIAKNKAAQTNLPLQLTQGDMRTIELDQYDAIIAMFNAVGHLNKPDFIKTIGNIGKRLNKGGSFIFDIFNIDAIDENDMSDFDMDMTKYVDGTKIHNKQVSKLDREQQLLTSFDEYTITDADGSKTRKSHKFSLQIYNANELKQFLTQCGFEIIKQYAMDGSEFDRTTSQSILTVATKSC